MNSYMKWGIGVLAVILLVPLALNMSSGNSSQQLRVITYNVQFLPGLAATNSKRPNTGYRASRIVEEIAQYDVIALQEMFDDHWRQFIIEGVREAWGGEAHVFESPPAAGHIAIGGCVVISRYPITETNSVVFQNFSTMEEYGFNADGLAAKGVIHTRLMLGKDEGSSLDIFVTHIEAAARDKRPLQYAEMAAFIKRVGMPNIPMLLLGDLNTNGKPSNWSKPKSQYSQLLHELNQSRPIPIIDVWRELKGEALGGTTEQDPAALGNRIDYVFYGPGESASLSLEPIDTWVEPYQDESIVALSDHNAVVAEFTIR
ncbi:MAG: hypothetical protein COA73_08255 [Candidatus Hydrogenedentota bacterium]|nr:MAG: hypothetical protein COA73_08255 [Candidatus Hydrogenedentota bacterium]